MKYPAGSLRARFFLSKMKKRTLFSQPPGLEQEHVPGMGIGIEEAVGKDLFRMDGHEPQLR